MTVLSCVRIGCLKNVYALLFFAPHDTFKMNPRKARTSPTHFRITKNSKTQHHNTTTPPQQHKKVLGAAYPWISRRLLTRPPPELRAALRRLLYKGGRFRFDRLSQLLEQAARARAPPPPPPPSSSASSAAAASPSFAGFGGAVTATSGGGGGGGGSAAGEGPLALLLSPGGGYVREVRCGVRQAVSGGGGA